VGNFEVISGKFYVVRTSVLVKIMNRTALLNYNFC